MALWLLIIEYHTCSITKELTNKSIINTLQVYIPLSIYPIHSSMKQERSKKIHNEHGKRTRTRSYLFYFLQSAMLPKSSDENKNTIITRH